MLKPRADVICRVDESTDGVLEALFNTEPLPHAFEGIVYKLTVNPNGTVRAFERDESEDIEDFEWEDATALPIWHELLAAGLRQTIDLTETTETEPCHD